MAAFLFFFLFLSFSPRGKGKAQGVQEFNPRARKTSPRQIEWLVHFQAEIDTTVEPKWRIHNNEVEGSVALNFQPASCKQTEEVQGSGMDWVMWHIPRLVKRGTCVDAEYSARDRKKMENLALREKKYM